MLSDNNQQHLLEDYMNSNMYDCALIAVPTDQVGLFTRLRDLIIAGEIDAGVLVGDSPRETAVKVPNQGHWTPSMIDELHGSLTYPLVRRLLDTCADRPGEWVMKAEIDTFSDNGPLQLRNELGAFSKLTNRLFKGIIWPIEYLKSEEGYRYRMPVGVAEMWRNAAS
jgi:hypothetical protein